MCMRWRVACCLGRCAHAATSFASLNKALARIKLTDTLGGGKSRVNVNVGVVDITAGSDYLSLGACAPLTGASCCANVVVRGQATCWPSPTT